MYQRKGMCAYLEDERGDVHILGGSGPQLGVAHAVDGEEGHDGAHPREAALDVRDAEGLAAEGLHRGGAVGDAVQDGGELPRERRVGGAPPQHVVVVGGGGGGSWARERNDRGAEVQDLHERVAERHVYAILGDGVEEGLLELMLKPSVLEVRCAREGQLVEGRVGALGIAGWKQGDSLQRVLILVQVDRVGEGTLPRDAIHSAERSLIALHQLAVFFFFVGHFGGGVCVGGWQQQHNSSERLNHYHNNTNIIRTSAVRMMCVVRAGYR